MKKIFFLTILILKTIVAFSLELDETIATLKINKLEASEMISIYFQIEENEPLISLEEILSSFSINNYDLKNEKLVFQLNGENRIIELNRIGIYEGQTLVKLNEVKKIFNNTIVNWNISEMSIEISTKEVLPWIFLKKQELKRKKLDRNNFEQNNILKDKWNFFTPGILNISYFKENFEDKKGNYLYLNNTNQFLWGSLTKNISITDKEIKLNSIFWEREVYDERKIVIGDGYNNIPFSLNTKNAYTGINISSKNSWDQSLNIQKNNIRGYAPDGLMVELYENGILKAYQIAKNSEFNFQVEFFDGINQYEVWIYNDNGLIEKKKISLYGNNNFLKKNKFDYELKLGQSKSNPNFQFYNIKLKYGLTDNITLGMNPYNLEYKDKKFNNYSFLYYYQLWGDWINTTEVNYSANLNDSKENMYRIEIKNSNQKISNTFSFENYKNLDKKIFNGDYDRIFYARSRVSLFSLSTNLYYGKQIDSYKNTYKNTYGIGMNKSFFHNYISVNLNLGKNYYSDGKNEDSFDFRVSYNIKYKYLNSMVFGYSMNKNQSEYDLMIGKNRNTDDSINYFFNIHNDNKETKVGLTLSYSFGSKISFRSSSEWRGEKHNSNLETKVAIDFKSPDKFVDSEKYGDSSVEGIVYIDLNDNGNFDEKDECVQGVQLKNSSKTITTDENGKYYFSNITSKNVQEMKIKILNDEYLMGYKIAKELKFETLPGGKLNINIPLKEIKTLIGFIEFDENFYLDEVQRILKDMTVKFTNIKTKETQEIKLSDETFIGEINQGEYFMEIIFKDSKQLFKIKNDKINVKAGGETEKYLEVNFSKDKEDILVEIDQG